MKKLILLELVLLFLATSFQSHNPPGWYQQTLPVSGNIQDIFFLDSFNGWTVTDNGYILRTSNGGDDWNIELDSAGYLHAIQFIDNLTGYALGNNASNFRGEIYKTTNGGSDWDVAFNFNPVGLLWDMSFVNKDTGWVCSKDFFDGGVFKTTNGGVNWQRQLNYGVNNPLTIFFLDGNTGWTGSDRSRVYKTTNGGTNWNLHNIFPGGLASIGDILFFNTDTGFVSAARIYRTTNGGTFWDTANESGVKLSFINNLTGWAGSNNKVKKTFDGLNWFEQPSPIFVNYNVRGIDSLNAFAGGTGLVRTTDGGGLSSINQNSNSVSEQFTLKQNYPNPFNPKTVISYELRVTNFVTLKIFDVRGKEIKTLVNKTQTSGKYKIEFDGTELTSGVYFYRLDAKNERANQVFSETKKMILTK